nr:cGMP-specific 3',5'-cyclic phosphodiesterase-like [Equus asinus]XP_044622396.1 cGMP-specific 3',5'-cyclic phosphodiesterase-like [Equus asinus]
MERRARGGRVLRSPRSRAPPGVQGPPGPQDLHLELPTFAVLPFGDKTREMVNAWFADRVHTIPVCKEGIRGHPESCSSPFQQAYCADSSAPGTPTRKISAS